MNADKRVSLFDMKVGAEGIVVNVDGGYGIVRRLDSMGIRIGSKIQKVTGQLMRGPIMLRVGNTRVAVGFGMARRIWVEVEK